MNETSRLRLAEFAEFLVVKRFVVEDKARFYVHWVEMFLRVPVPQGETRDGHMRIFLEDLGRSGRYEDWQIQQAGKAIRLYFAHFLQDNTWRSAAEPRITASPEGNINVADTLRTVQMVLRAKHYSYRTEQTYLSWISGFLNYIMGTDGNRSVETCHVTSKDVGDYIKGIGVTSRQATMHSCTPS